MYNNSTVIAFGYLYLNRRLTKSVLITLLLIFHCYYHAAKIQHEKPFVKNFFL